MASIWSIFLLFCSLNKVFVSSSNKFSVEFRIFENGLWVDFALWLLLWNFSALESSPGPLEQRGPAALDTLRGQSEGAAMRERKSPAFLGFRLAAHLPALRAAPFDGLAPFEKSM